MYVVSDTMQVDAPIDRCFLLSTSIDLFAKTLNMRVADRRTGLIEPGDRLIWHGWKFGLPQMHETLITQYDRPNNFQDTMGRGRFERLQHDHDFVSVDDHTVLQDRICFSLPFGAPGDLVAKYVMLPYIRRILHTRLLLLKRVAESEEWREFLTEPLG